jgi:cerevisin
MLSSLYVFFFLALYSSPILTRLFQAINSGVPVIVPIGSSGTDGSNTSPSRVSQAIAVGAMTIADARASFSNYGPLVDLFAPGVQITSAWIGSTTVRVLFFHFRNKNNNKEEVLMGCTMQATNTLSGTSSVAHVAGLAAYLRSLIGTTITVEQALARTAVRNVLSGLPSGTLNAIAGNDVTKLGYTGL